MQLPELPERGELRVRPEVDDVQRGDLRAAQPPRELRLEQRVITPRLQQALAAPRPAGRDAPLTGSEKRLQLVDGQRPAAWIALKFVQMRDEVALVKQLPGPRPNSRSQITVHGYRRSHAYSENPFSRH